MPADALLPDDETSVVELVRAAARQLGRPADRIRLVRAGWDSLVAELPGPDATWMLRLPRRAEVAARMAAEARLLTALGSALSFAVPRPEYAGTVRGVPYLAYRRVAGRPFRAGDDAAAVGRALRELHAFPVGRAAQLLGLAPDLNAWLGRHRRLAAEIEVRVLPLLEAGLAERVQAALADFVGGDWSEVRPCLVHADLGSEHLLMASTRQLSGILDFGDATIGDPAIDFVGVRITGGQPAVHAAASAYGQPVDRRRLEHYFWLGSAHAVLYGLDTGDEREVEDGKARLAMRLRGASGQC